MEFQSQLQTLLELDKTIMIFLHYSTHGDMVVEAGVTNAQLFQSFQQRFIDQQ